MAGHQLNNAQTVIPLICLQHIVWSVSWDSFAAPSPAPLPAASPPRSFPTSSQHRASPLPVRPTSSAQNIPGRSKCCLHFLMAAVICSTLFFFLFLGLSKTLISVLLFFFFIFLLLQTSSLDHLLDITAMTRPYPWLDKLIQELPRWETGLGSSNECKHSNICYLHDKAVSLDLT